MHQFITKEKKNEKKEEEGSYQDIRFVNFLILFVPALRNATREFYLHIANIISYT